ncbi:hypothetical protein RRG08_040746 [Elysia crispata]|uniref:Uncharacterized protein n=1 Tax=Elysia crispata TaxID=231223 RepID=A0AAE1EE43_9GAST|nr:hypothetical protein RRG08_040746 [Elysia crispata]
MAFIFVFPRVQKDSLACKSRMLKAQIKVVWMTVNGMTSVLTSNIYCSVYSCRYHSVRIRIGLSFTRNPYSFMYLYLVRQPFLLLTMLRHDKWMFDALVRSKVEEIAETFLIA